MVRGRYAVVWAPAAFALVLLLVGASPWPSRTGHVPVAVRVATAASEQALARSHRHGHNRRLGTASATRCQPWRTVPSPDVGDLVALAAVSADDIWAVGARGLLH